jgi:membrane protein implicated in regulation of membrane protease activity
MVSIMRFLRTLWSDMTTSTSKLSTGALVRTGSVAGLLVFLVLLLLSDMEWWLALVLGLLVLAVTVLVGRWRGRRRERNVSPVSGEMPSK